MFIKEVTGELLVVSMSFLLLSRFRKYMYEREEEKRIGKRGGDGEESYQREEQVLLSYYVVPSSALIFFVQRFNLFLIMCLCGI